MSSDFDACIEDPVIFQRKDAANTLVGFFFVTVLIFLVLYLILVWEKATPSAYNYGAWSYDGKRGRNPGNWQNIAPDRDDPPNQCGDKRQSPIWINTTNLTKHHQLGRPHGRQPLWLRLINYNDPVDSGLVHVEYEQLIIMNLTGNRFVLDPNGIMFRLEKIFFRFGRDSLETEHRLNDEHFALEIQFFHYRLRDHPSIESPVVALSSLFKITPFPNEQLRECLDALEAYPQPFFHLPLATLLPMGNLQILAVSNISSYDLLAKSYVTYRGSLTVPPCTQEVTWYVFFEPVGISLRQLLSIRSVPSLKSSVGDNCRPLQPINGRTIEIIRDDTLPVVHGLNQGQIHGWLSNH